MRAGGGPANDGASEGSEISRLRRKSGNKKKLRGAEFKGFIKRIVKDIQSMM